jgi:hypothetical protein
MRIGDDPGSQASFCSGSKTDRALTENTEVHRGVFLRVLCALCEKSSGTDSREMLRMAAEKVLDEAGM